jgi:hypothetical protein
MSENTKTTKKTPCDTRRCRQEGTIKRGMFNFCQKHWEEFVIGYPVEVKDAKTKPRE